MDKWARRGRYALESGLFRISRSMVYGDAKYTVWQMVGDEAVRHGTHATMDEAKREAERLNREHAKQ